jgi:hypothetical protein
MALTNAEKQQRWKERNQVVLTWPAEDIAGKLMDMEDQGKLRKIVNYLKDHLKHPDRTWQERAIALGRMGVPGLHGPLSKRKAMEYVRNPPPPQNHSWLVEATTKDGKRWRNGVRLATKEEAQAYIESHVRFDLEKAGYLTARLVRCEDESANCFLYRRTRGGRCVTLGFPDGLCTSLHWHNGSGGTVMVRHT